MRTAERLVGWGRDVMLLPRVAWLSARAPRDWRAGWERYWGAVRTTGVGGDVLWDSGDLDEVDIYRALIADHLDTSLPLVDVGCGNGRFTRHLAPLFHSTVGADLSANALTRARQESAGQERLTFAELDVTVPGAGADLAVTIGREANVFVRGLFHVLEPSDRAAAARNLRAIVGFKGRVLLAETNFSGSKLHYLRHLGATARHIPVPLKRAIVDIPAPGHFGADECRAAFLSADWEVVADGFADILTIPLRGPTAAEHIPGYYAILAPAPAGPSEGSAQEAPGVTRTPAAGGPAKAGPAPAARPT